MSKAKKSSPIITNRPEPSISDRLFVFSQFPYDYAHFPLEITAGISLVQRPGHGVISEESLALYRYALPELNIPGVGCPNACIRISSQVKNQNKAFWLFLFSLRLVRPLQIGVSGSFLVMQNHITDPALYRISARINLGSPGPSPTNLEIYQLNDIKNAAKIYKKLCQILQKSNKKRYRRIINAINDFSAITTGQISLYSIIYSSLFSVLDGLFGSPAKGKQLGNRVQHFLEKIYPKPKHLGDWISVRYTEKRNPGSHGNPDFWLTSSGKYYQTDITQKKYSEILKLHEIVRLSFLGLLGFGPRILEEHSQIAWDFNSFFQKNQASHVFLVGQKPYLNHPYRSRRSRAILP
jgi:hypothetical protein